MVLLDPDLPWDLSLPLWSVSSVPASLFCPEIQKGNRRVEGLCQFCRLHELAFVLLHCVHCFEGGRTHLWRIWGLYLLLSRCCIVLCGRCGRILHLGLCGKVSSFLSFPSPKNQPKSEHYLISKRLLARDLELRVGSKWEWANFILFCFSVEFLSLSHFFQIESWGSTESPQGIWGGHLWGLSLFCFISRVSGDCCHQPAERGLGPLCWLRYRPAHPHHGILRGDWTPGLQVVISNASTHPFLCWLFPSLVW